MSLQLSVQPIGISWAFSQCTMAPACGSSEANSSSRRRSVRCCWGCWEVCQLSLRQGAKRVVGSWLWPLLEITALSKILSKGPSIHEHTVFYDILWYSMIFYMKISRGSSPHRHSLKTWRLNCFRKMVAGWSVCFFDHRMMVSFYIPEHPKISQSYFFQKDILVGSGWWFGTWLEKFSHHIGNNTPNWRTHIFQRGWTPQPA